MYFNIISIQISHYITNPQIDQVANQQINKNDEDNDDNDQREDTQENEDDDMMNDEITTIEEGAEVNDMDDDTESMNTKSNEISPNNTQSFDNFYNSMQHNFEIQTKKIIETVSSK